MGQLLQYEINPDGIDSEKLGNEGIQPESAYEHAIDINAIRKGKYVDSLVNYSTEPGIYHQEPKGNRIIDLGDGKKIIDLRGKGNIYLGEGEAEVFLTKKELRDLCYNLLLHGGSRELYQETEPLSELLSEVEEDLKWGSDGIGELRLENGRLLLKYENPNYSYSYDITEIAKEEGFDFWRYIHALGLERTGLAGGESPYELEEEEKNSSLTENEKLKKAFALGASILIPLGCSAPGLFGKYNLNAKAVLDDAVKFLKKAFPVDNPDFGVIGVAEASFLPDDPKVWYEVGKDGSFTFPYLDPSWWGPKDESCWQAYKDGWYDWYLEGWGKHVPKDKVLTKQEFEKVFPLYLIGSARTEFEEWPPKNANGYQPKVKLILTNPKEEKRAILKLDIAPIWKYAYGWWPKGPKNGENIDLEFADNPINAMYSAGWYTQYALLDYDGDKIPEVIAPEKEGANCHSITIPTFVEEDSGVYIFLPHGKWIDVYVKYPALEKKDESELYEKLEKETGLKYLGSVYERDLINGIPFDIQPLPDRLIIEKAEKPEPTNDIPTSVGPVPTITEGENSSVGDKVQAEPEKTEKTPGYGIGEILSAIAAAGVALGKGARRKRR